MTIRNRDDGCHLKFKKAKLSEMDRSDLGHGEERKVAC